MKITKRHLIRLIKEARLSEADETGGATTSTLKKGLALAFPDWAEDIEGMELKSSFVDEFASMIGNAMKAAESGDLVKAATASNKSAAALEGRIIREYSEHASYADLSDTFEDTLEVLDDVMIKYVDSKWLADHDHASLVKDIESLYDALNMLNNTFNQLTSGRAGTKMPGNPI